MSGSQKSSSKRDLQNATAEKLEVVTPSKLKVKRVRTSGTGEKTSRKGNKSTAVNGVPYIKKGDNVRPELHLIHNCLSATDPLSVLWQGMRPLPASYKVLWRKIQMVILDMYRHHETLWGHAGVGIRVECVLTTSESFSKSDGEDEIHSSWRNGLPENSQHVMRAFQLAAGPVRSDTDPPGAGRARFHAIWEEAAKHRLNNLLYEADKGHHPSVFQVGQWENRVLCFRLCAEGGFYSFAEFLSEYPGSLLLTPFAGPIITSIYKLFKETAAMGITVSEVSLGDVSVTLSELPLDNERHKAVAFVEKNIVSRMRITSTKIMPPLPSYSSLEPTIAQVIEHEVPWLCALGDFVFRSFTGISMIEGLRSVLQFERTWRDNWAEGVTVWYNKRRAVLGAEEHEDLKDIDVSEVDEACDIFAGMFTLLGGSDGFQGENVQCQFHETLTALVKRLQYHRKNLMINTCSDVFEKHFSDCVPIFVGFIAAALAGDISATREALGQFANIEQPKSFGHHSPTFGVARGLSSLTSTVEWSNRISVLDHLSCRNLLVANPVSIEPLVGLITQCGRHKPMKAFDVIHMVLSPLSVREGHLITGLFESVASKSDKLTGHLVRTCLDLASFCSPIGTDGKAQDVIDLPNMAMAPEFQQALNSRTVDRQYEIVWSAMELDLDTEPTISAPSVKTIPIEIQQPIGRWCIQNDDNTNKEVVKYLQSILCYLFSCQDDLKLSTHELITSNPGAVPLAIMTGYMKKYGPVVVFVRNVETDTLDSICLEQGGRAPLLTNTLYWGKLIGRFVTQTMDSVMTHNPTYMSRFGTDSIVRIKGTGSQEPRMAWLAMLGDQPQTAVLLERLLPLLTLAGDQSPHSLEKFLGLLPKQWSRMTDADCNAYLPMRSWNNAIPVQLATVIWKMITGISLFCTATAEFWAQQDAAGRQRQGNVVTAFDVLSRSRDEANGGTTPRHVKSYKGLGYAFATCYTLFGDFPPFCEMYRNWQQLSDRLLAIIDSMFCGDGEYGATSEIFTKQKLGGRDYTDPNIRRWHRTLCDIIAALFAGDRVSAGEAAKELARIPGGDETLGGTSTLVSQDSQTAVDRLRGRVQVFHKALQDNNRRLIPDFFNDPESNPPAVKALLDCVIWGERVSASDLVLHNESVTTTFGRIPFSILTVLHSNSLMGNGQLVIMNEFMQRVPHMENLHLIHFEITGEHKVAKGLRLQNSASYVPANLSISQFLLGQLEDGIDGAAPRLAAFGFCCNAKTGNPVTFMVSEGSFRAARRLANVRPLFANRDCMFFVANVAGRYLKWFGSGRKSRPNPSNMWIESAGGWEMWLTGLRGLTMFGRLTEAHPVNGTQPIISYCIDPVIMVASIKSEGLSSPTPRNMQSTIRSPITIASYKELVDKKLKEMDGQLEARGDEASAYLNEESTTPYALLSHWLIYTVFRSQIFDPAFAKRCYLNMATDKVKRDSFAAEFNPVPKNPKGRRIQQHAWASYVDLFGDIGGFHKDNVSAVEKRLLEIYEVDHKRPGSILAELCVENYREVHLTSTEINKDTDTDISTFTSLRSDLSKIVTNDEEVVTSGVKDWKRNRIEQIFRLAAAFFCHDSIEGHKLLQVIIHELPLSSQKLISASTKPAILSPAELAKFVEVGKTKMEVQHRFNFFSNRQAHGLLDLKMKAAQTGNSPKCLLYYGDVMKEELEEQGLRNRIRSKFGRQRDARIKRKDKGREKRMDTMSSRRASQILTPRLVSEESDVASIATTLGNVL